MRRAKHAPSSSHPHRRTRSAAPWWLRATLTLLFLTPLAQAQEKSTTTIEFRVTRFDPGDGKPPEFRAGTETFQVPITYIAGPFKATLRDDFFLDFRRGAEEVPEISLRIEPAERAHLLLVFMPRESSFRVIKINTPPDKVKGGDRLVINAAPDELAIKLGDMKPIRVPSGKSGLLSGPPGKEIVSLPVLIQRKVADQWQLASTEQWPCDPLFRKFLFAYIHPRTGHLAFHAVAERL
jgi:hypothetical protein